VKEAGNRATQVLSEAGPGLLHEMIGEYVVSPGNKSQLWRDLGVNVRDMEGDMYAVAPQHFSNYRPFDNKEAMYLRDMQGNELPDDANPGIRLEANVVTEAEEAQIISELQELASLYGYDFALDVEDPSQGSWRLTGRDEKKTDLPLAPWGWGQDFDNSKLPAGLRLAASRIQSLDGYPLGPLRDVTVNVRTSDDYQMAPHVDPLGDGPNSFVLSLLSSAVVTFSPIASLRTNAIRANDDELYIQQSYTDDDIDCLVPQRAIYHFSGNARYLWTHAVRPSVRPPDAEDPDTFERWGTWDRVLRREKDRVAIIFSFADPQDV